ncbi:MAG: hypothetical protein LQ346_007037 [Caloplaca aetnensis]|nr:MAG: hypothetical protein LQ346_007037 [Caloplaca aetnensis]
MEDEFAPFLEEPGKLKSVPERRYVPTSRARKFSFLTSSSTHLFTIFITSLFWGAFLHYALKHQKNSLQSRPTTTAAFSHPENTPHSTLLDASSYIHCGNTHATALALNCTYDILANHWLPDPCSDPLSVHEYQAFGPSWHGYASAAHTGPPLSIAGMAEAGVYYTNMHDHILHCATLWRRQFRAIFDGGGRALDSLIVDPEHTMHCSDFLVRMTEYGVDMRAIPIQVEVGFAGCWVKGQGDGVCE